MGLGLAGTWMCCRKPRKGKVENVVIFEREEGVMIQGKDPRCL